MSDDTASKAAGAPIACTLDGSSIDRRVDEWRSLLAGGVRQREPLPRGLRLELSAVDVAELARLVAAEQACCQFFAFAITIDERGVGLEVQAPADAVSLVHALFG
jgi:hypothetical protein